MDSVGTAAEQPPCTRIGLAAGELISEVAARVTELARAVHDLERLVHAPGPTGARGTGPGSRPDPDPEPRPDPGPGAGAGRTEAGLGDARDEAEFSLFIEESNLTRREAEVLRHLLDGHSNRRISRSLLISESTVKNHLHAIFVKLDTRDRTQVVAKAYRFMAEHNARPARTRHPPDDAAGERPARPIEEP